MRLLLVGAYVSYRLRRLPCVLFGRTRYFRHLGVSCRGRADCGKRVRR